MPLYGDRYDDRFDYPEGDESIYDQMEEDVYNCFESNSTFYDCYELRDCIEGFYYDLDQVRVDYSPRLLDPEWGLTWSEQADKAGCWDEVDQLCWDALPPRAQNQVEDWYQDGDIENLALFLNEPEGLESGNLLHPRLMAGGDIIFEDCCSLDDFYDEGYWMDFVGAASSYIDGYNIGVPLDDLHA